MAPEVRMANNQPAIPRWHPPEQTHQDEPVDFDAGRNGGDRVPADHGDVAAKRRPPHEE